MSTLTFWTLVGFFLENDVNFDSEFSHVWYWRKKLPERKGQKCRILVRGKKMNSILVEFEDGFRIVTSRYAVRRAT